MLPAFIEGLAEAARAKKAWRQKQEMERIEWEESRKRAHEEAIKRYEERQRVENLTQQIDSWSRCRRIRQYIAAFKEKCRPAREVVHLEGSPSRVDGLGARVRGQHRPGCPDSKGAPHDETRFRAVLVAGRREPGLASTMTFLALS